jgi:DNA-3-methyladenine glycosylase II
MSSQLVCSVALPAGFRPGDILAFHRRDTQEVAESVSANGLRKGLLWNGLPACLSIEFQAGQAIGVLPVDGEISAHCLAQFEAMLRRMLGLSQDVATFEQQYLDHPQLGVLLARQAGLRVPVAASPFEALTWAITGQQISIAVAVSLRRKLISAAGIRHSGGLLCYPTAPQIAALSLETLRQAGFSASKSQTLLTLSGLIVADQLPLDSWLQSLPIELIRQHLLAVRGIGPWTVNYSLLRGFGWLDGSLHGDVAVRRGIQRLLDSPEQISEAQAQVWLAEFAPWRALVAAHLWAMQTQGAA